MFLISTYIIDITVLGRTRIYQSEELLTFMVQGPNPCSGVEFFFTELLVVFLDKLFVFGSGFNGQGSHTGASCEH